MKFGAVLGGAVGSGPKHCMAGGRTTFALTRFCFFCFFLKVKTHYNIKQHNVQKEKKKQPPVILYQTHVVSPSVVVSQVPWQETLCTERLHK